MGDSTDGDLSSEEIYEEMEVLEPYTAGELASVFNAPKRRIQKLLERLSNSGKSGKRNPSQTRQSGSEKHQSTSVRTAGTSTRSSFSTQFFRQYNSARSVENRYNNT